MTRTGSPLQAVLFDMDGTLIDSESLWGRAESATVAALGGEWTHEDHRRNIGGASAQVARYILDLTGADAPPEEVAARMQAEFARALDDGAPLRPGAKELVALVAESGLPSALVTSTRRALVERAIGAIGLDSFDLSVAGDEVEANKPDPAPYLTAARLLGVDPAACVAFEDSAVGVASAMAAGCVTVAVPDQVELPPAPGLVVRDSLAGIDLAWLESLVSAKSI
ncbi:HAD family hydrolase [Streptomonospora nanhaiensis]|uniref:HAD superfamily hydrolase (TIGR01509 family) n=1 Tax=Streptomonospora nanhaiensis TaxID=1323731 RepID=A0A853BG35_9ACTN|nr:HAD family phosphatase [Streptomonospora nanhaiensis]MBV2367003.1 HAD family phosphatase [Streptomonospora nanhaiensis]MBX9387792.1 HAD family phosphatase [Streptomonospora nanhaiensis]NYI93980.1 HAD superfamily hydrolase (TIGR01509 family) [Streptomonospora nanhaiensis]